MSSPHYPQLASDLRTVMPGSLAEGLQKNIIFYVHELSDLGINNGTFQFSQ